MSENPMLQRSLQQTRALSVTEGALLEPLADVAINNKFNKNSLNNLVNLSEHHAASHSILVLLDV